MTYFKIIPTGERWRIELYGTKKLYIRDVEATFPTKQDADGYLKRELPRAKPLVKDTGTQKPEPGPSLPVDLDVLKAYTEPAVAAIGQRIEADLLDMYAGFLKAEPGVCGCGAPLAFATGIGEYCTAGFKCTEASGLQKQTPAPASPELTALLEDLRRDSRKYRLTNLETGTTWAFTVKDGRVVPEREVCPK